MGILGAGRMGYYENGGVRGTGPRLTLRYVGNSSGAGRDWGVRVLIALLCGFFLCTGVRAQIVNIEDKRQTLDTFGWAGQLDLAGGLTQNTQRVVTGNAGLRLDHRGKQHNFLLLADYRLVQVSGDNALNAGFGHVRYGWEPPGRDGWRWESFSQVQYDERLRLDVRFLLGTGIRRRLYRRGDWRGYLGVLYMYEYDELSRQNIFYRDHRLSNYLTLAFSPRAGVRVASTTYYQPRLPDFNLARLSTVTTLSLQLAGKFSFTTRLALTQDKRVSQDLPEVPATTYAWTNGLRYAF